ncbi:type II toxin-antitoxin system PemK/MazF family toxin [Helcococcus bovis]|uniref:type II toxin-antitoxin system PemK/MazF family toxin n=1 Tax=Helcococcus bovis TaxID=3153252 RepID=UPI0038BA9740
MDNEQIEIKNKLNTEALNEISSFLANSDFKKSKLLSYWFKDYIKFLSFEDKFDSKRLVRYKKGTILKVNFGFNVGSELGGLHYCVVLEKNNPLSSSVVTVAPLTSLKEKVDVENLRYTKVYIEDELKSLLKNKLDKIKENYQSVHGVTGKITALKEQRDKSEKELKYALSEYKKMKNGSIVLLDNITTISKLKIYNPKHKNDLLYGLRLSDDTLNKIDDKIKELFLKI